MAGMRRLACVLCLIGLAAGASWASLPLRLPAPEFPTEDVWVNAKPLTLARLRKHRVVLVGFFNSANLNSLRALKELDGFHEAYAQDGVMVIGVHTPLYPFQRDPSYMQREIKRLGIDFPVVLDDDRRIWNAYHNEGWPSFFVLDRYGRISFELEGEARYRELEVEIRSVEKELGYEPPRDLIAADPPAQDCGGATAEDPVPRDKPVPEVPDGPATAVVTSAHEGFWYRVGPWKLDDAALRLQRSNDSERSLELQLVYRGAQGFAVLGPALGKTSRVFVRQDTLWLTALNAGADVKFDDDGHSYVDVRVPGLFALTKNPNDDLHLLGFAPAKAGAGVFAFAGADRCLPYSP